jgi:hypothetical protein
MSAALLYSNAFGHESALHKAIGNACKCWDESTCIFDLAGVNGVPQLMGKHGDEVKPRFPSQEKPSADSNARVPVSESLINCVRSHHEIGVIGIDTGGWRHQELHSPDPREELHPLHGSKDAVGLRFNQGFNCTLSPMKGFAHSGPFFGSCDLINKL